MFHVPFLRGRTARVAVYSAGVSFIALMHCQVVQAGPYSGHSNDPGNAFDAPVAANDPRIKAWAATVVDYAPAPGVTNNIFSINDDPTLALGPAGPDALPNDPNDPFDDTSLRTVSLGDLSQQQIDTGVQPGSLTLGFAGPIMNGAGHDFAVFENGFDNSFGSEPTYVFGELAFVEVSSDGVNFARFRGVAANAEGDLDTSFSTPGTHDFASFDPTNVHNLAGKHLADWGTPFDLEDLANDPLVFSGDVNLNNILFVRLVDIPGSGDYLDSLNNPIFDSWVTAQSGGLDVDAIGVLNGVPEPAAGLLLVVGGAVLIGIRRRT